MQAQAGRQPIPSLFYGYAPHERESGTTTNHKPRQLRCDETKPSCRNCTQKGLECPGYQQRLQWSTKHERPYSATASGPENFDKLVTAASEVIGQKYGESSAGPSSNGAAAATASEGGESSRRT